MTALLHCIVRKLTDSILLIFVLYTLNSKSIIRRIFIKSISHQIKTLFLCFLSKATATVNAFHSFTGHFFVNVIISLSTLMLCSGKVLHALISV